MNVVFRVDASVLMGTGHLMRCAALADALRQRGAKVRFICRSHSGNLIDLLRQRTLPVTVLPALRGADAGGEGYAAWLGASQAEDAAQTLEALSGQRPDWLVVDHYALDRVWERQVRACAGRLMVIDDLANRHHDCDVLLDQNFSLMGERRYAGLVPDACRLLMGPRYALLQAEYAIYRKTLGKRDGRVANVLLFFGGSDPQNITGTALEALCGAGLEHLEVDVVVGASNLHRQALEAQVRARPRTSIHGPRPHLADLMSRADLALGAGGATTWERMCLGLPALVVSIAENQRPACEALSGAGLIDYAGSAVDLDADHLAQRIRARLRDAEQLAGLAARNRLQVDGLGALRVVEVMLPTATGDLRLRTAALEDICSGADQTQNDHTFVLEAAGLAVGRIAFDRIGGDEARVGYALDPIVQGRGWDARLLNLGGHLLRELEPVLLGGDQTGIESARGPFLRMRPRGATSRSIAVLSDHSSWINRYIGELQLDWLIEGHRVLWVHEPNQLRPADFCFYLGCGQIVRPSILSLYRHNLVVHESDLPQGKGWSPLSWQIVQGRHRIPVTLFEAAEKVDSGVIYAQEWMEFQGHELIDQLREVQARASIDLCKRFVADYPQILAMAREQSGAESFYPRRQRADSEFDAARSIEAQFDLLRVVDNQRYPAFFVCRGHRYTLKIESEEQP